jgi:ATP-dependent RNA helicase DDX1
MTVFLSNAVESDMVSLIQSCCRLPTAIQYECIPLILGGGDVLAAAETGSGKTGAFGLPILQVVHESIRSRQAGGTSSSGYVSDQSNTQH